MNKRPHLLHACTHDLAAQLFILLDHHFFPFLFFYPRLKGKLTNDSPQACGRMRCVLCLVMEAADTWPPNFSTVRVMAPRTASSYPEMATLQHSSRSRSGSRCRCVLQQASFQLSVNNAELVRWSSQTSFPPCRPFLHTLPLLNSLAGGSLPTSCRPPLLPPLL